MRMSKRCFFLILFICFQAAGAYALNGQVNEGPAPDLRYIAPRDEAQIDLTGKDCLTFKWGRHVIPAGGRNAFRFKVYREADSVLVFEANLADNVYSVDVPSDKFSAGQEYTWMVQQRDQASMSWSNKLFWRFKVIK